MRSGATGTCLTALFGVACGAPQQDRPATNGARVAASWRETYDLDGDGTNDRIVSEFTGGAHCCYHVGATLSSTGKTIVLPFDLDGGYPRGLDLSRPDQFTIRARAGELPEIIYEIAVYDGEPQPLDPAWTERWQIRTHRVALCFAGGDVRVRDEAPTRPPCKR